MVKASLTGSIIGNLLLVLGASLLAGGLKFPIQRFNRTAAGAGSTLMVLADRRPDRPGPLPLPRPEREPALEHKLSVAVCVLLVFTYGLSLLFSLVTHRELFSGLKEDVAAAISEATWGLRHATALLLVATVFVAWMSEILVGAVEPASEALGLNEVFMGVFVVAIVGNAAEHSTAVIMALKNQMDLAVGIALGSALQIALFVAPVLVFASYFRDDADGPAVHDPGGRRRDPGRAGRPDGRRGRRVELARRGDAADDLRDPRRRLLLPARRTGTRAKGASRRWPRCEADGPEGRSYRVRPATRRGWAAARVLAGGLD